jgi:MFS family permease
VPGSDAGQHVSGRVQLAALASGHRGHCGSRTAVLEAKQATLGAKCLGLRHAAVHQTQYLIEIGFSASVAAWALEIVSVVAIPGQIGLGALSDRVGREWVWSAGCCGFAVCCAALIALEYVPSRAVLYLMVISQGFLGYALTSVMGPIVAEIFEGPHYGSIFGTITIALIGGGAVGPWIAGVIHDVTGSYRLAFVLAAACCVISAAATWIASPRNVRAVPGRTRSVLHM